MAPESGGEGELAKCEALALALREAGFRNFDRYDAPDSRVPSKTRPNLVVTVPGLDDSRTVWIMSHLDVVAAGRAREMGYRSPGPSSSGTESSLAAGSRTISKDS